MTQEDGFISCLYFSLRSVEKKVVREKRWKNINKREASPALFPFQETEQQQAHLLRKAGVAGWPERPVYSISQEGPVSLFTQEQR